MFLLHADGKVHEKYSKRLLFCLSETGLQHCAEHVERMARQTEVPISENRHDGGR